MSHDDQVQALITDITSILLRYSHEYDLTWTDAVGALEVVKHDVLNQMDEAEPFDKEDDDAET